MKSGRKPRISKEIIKDVEQCIVYGNYAVVACEYVGICEATYYSWLKRGERDEFDSKKTLYVEFLKSVKRATAEAEVRNVMVIQKASKETWQAAAWYLERKHKDRWSSRQEVTGKDGGAIEIDSPCERINSRITSLADRIGTVNDTQGHDGAGSEST